MGENKKPAASEGEEKDTGGESDATGFRICDERRSRGSPSSLAFLIKHGACQIG